MRIYLLGFMGCGKTSLGKRLARKLDYSFMDIDNLIEEKEGKSIHDIFAERGEEYFRQLEREYLQGTKDLSRAIIATGGGTPCYFDNMEFMNAHGVTVYLKMSPVSLSYRLKNAKRKRPLIDGLEGDELLAFIKDKLGEREPFYLRSHCIIKGESSKPSQIISLVFGH